MQSQDAKDPTESSFPEIFQRLRGMLEAHSARFTVYRDTSTCFGIDAAIGPATLAAWGGKARAARMPVAWVEIKKSYVSYHLMGIYTNAKLEATLSQSLRSRKQGKSCFNFTRVDEGLLEEIGIVTAASLLALSNGGYITHLPRDQAGG